MNKSLSMNKYIPKIDNPLFNLNFKKKLIYINLYTTYHILKLFFKIVFFSLKK